MNNQPTIEVGILVANQIEFSFSGPFNMGNKRVSRKFTAKLDDDKIQIEQNSEIVNSEEPLIFIPTDEDSSFELKDVVIGVDFHWEQKENQRFKGALKLIRENDKVRAVNIVNLEDYLRSVISSEMSSTSSMELLKAHAVISRSWLLAQIEKSKVLKDAQTSYITSTETEDEISRWYDREDHDTFDVCADDHCQRYQGITKIHSEKALQAITKTFGEVLYNQNKVCDARFSKCCGGMVESFNNVWEPIEYSYLVKTLDNNEPLKDFDTNLKEEQNAEKWIRYAPSAFCNTTDKNILSQVLPDFDQATTDFYRWKVEYKQEELSMLIKKRSGIDFGWIKKLTPVLRGDSGRLIKLKIEGTKKTVTVGKELEIRKWLSPSHLYSSAFVIDHDDLQNDVPQKIILTGAGWGHGVGLCQIGAAVMGEQGYTYKEILNHYFKNTELKKLYRND